MEQQQKTIYKAGNQITLKRHWLSHYHMLITVLDVGAKEIKIILHMQCIFKPQVQRILPK